MATLTLAEAVATLTPDERRAWNRTRKALRARGDRYMTEATTAAAGTQRYYWLKARSCYIDAELPRKTRQVDALLRSC